jgi:hypothetical protein
MKTADTAGEAIRHGHVAAWMRLTIILLIVPAKRGYRTLTWREPVTASCGVKPHHRRRFVPMPGVFST